MVVDDTDSKSTPAAALPMSSLRLSQIAEAAIEALAGPILILDAQFRAVTANSAFYDALKIPKGTLEGKSVRELIQAPTGERSGGTDLETLMVRERNLQNVEIPCIVRPLTRKVLSVNTQRLNAKDDASELFLVEVRDVTRERDTEHKIFELNTALAQHAQDLQETVAELDSFTHSASHDLRIPLRLTNKIAYQLLRDYGDEIPAAAVEKVHMILDSTQEMGKLIEDLLVFSQVSRVPITKRRVDPRQLAQEAIAELSEELQNRDVNVTIGEMPECQADGALLKQVFVNLLANAVKFTRTREKSQIETGSTTIDEAVVYFVRDNGIGFDMTEADTMFMAFQRLHKALGFEGSGVGLALVKRIIERHQGRIWAEGTPNVGATFYFTLSDGRGRRGSVTGNCPIGT